MSGPALTGLETGDPSQILPELQRRMHAAVLKWEDHHSTGIGLLSQVAQGQAAVEKGMDNHHGSPAVQLLAAIQASRNLLEQMEATLEEMTVIKEAVGACHMACACGKEQEEGANTEADVQLAQCIYDVWIAHCGSMDTKEHVLLGLLPTIKEPALVASAAAWRLDPFIATSTAVQEFKAACAKLQQLA